MGLWGFGSPIGVGSPIGSYRGGGGHLWGPIGAGGSYGSYMGLWGFGGSYRVCRGVLWILWGPWVPVGHGSYRGWGPRGLCGVFGCC